MHKLTRSAMVAVVALVVASCSLPGSGGSGQSSSQAPAAGPTESPTDTPASSSPSPASPSGAAGSAQPTPADPSQPSAGDQLGAAVATRTSAKSGKKVTLTLYPVHRDGSTSHLNLTLSSPVAKIDGLQVADLLSDGDYSASDKSGLAADGLQLVDGTNAKLYLVASDGRGQCLCSRDLSAVFLSMGAPVLFSATFAAPPAAVTQVDVRVPNFGTVKNVPVQ